MSIAKILQNWLAGVLLAGALAAPTQAQVFIYGPPALGPRLAPVVPVVVMPRPYPVVTAYRLPGYVAPAAAYSAYRPVVAPPVYAPVGVVTTVRARPVVVGPGIGGLPNTYVPGQPVRNVLRFAVP